MARRAGGRAGGVGRSETGIRRDRGEASRDPELQHVQPARDPGDGQPLHRDVPRRGRSRVVHASQRIARRRQSHRPVLHRAGEERHARGVREPPGQGPGVPERGDRALRRVRARGGMGAAGAMLGTRFVATVESRAHDVYKHRILSSRGDDTALTICFDGGWSNAPHRVLRNGTLEGWESAGCPSPGRRPGEQDAIADSSTGDPILRYEDTAPKVGMTGQLEEMALYCGTGAGKINDIPSAGELVRRLWSDAVAAGAPKII